jgi:hypothetical protein
VEDHPRLFGGSVAFLILIPILAPNVRTIVTAARAILDVATVIASPSPVATTATPSAASTTSTVPATSPHSQYGPAATPTSFIAQPAATLPLATPSQVPRQRCQIEGIWPRGDGWYPVHVNVTVRGRCSSLASDKKLWFIIRQERADRYSRVGPILKSDDGDFEGVAYTFVNRLAEVGERLRLTLGAVPQDVSERWYREYENLSRRDDGSPPYLPLITSA